MNKSQKSQRISDRNGNTSKAFRSRSWFITINNPSFEKDLKNLKLLGLSSQSFCFQLEEGENNTPHFQGTFKFKNQVTFNSMKKKLPRAHIEVCRNFNASIDYCSKSKGRIQGPWTNITTLSKPKSSISGRLRLWQCILQKYLTMEPDDRTITWVVDEVGNTGKTKFCKHLVETTDGTLYLSGRAKYMKYAIMQYVDQGKTPNILLLDLSRSQEDYVSYQGIEEIKNGIFFNTHYEAKMITYKEPHVVVFANFKPEKHKLSLDRWNIVYLERKCA